MMVSKKGNMFLYKAIRQIVENVNTNFYGNNSLEPTGPIMLGNVIIKNRLKVNIDMQHYKNGGYIIYKNRFVISTEYSEYRDEQNYQYNQINIKNYGTLWDERSIYK
jgi:hypothetical protein